MARVASVRMPRTREVTMMKFLMLFGLLSLTVARAQDEGRSPFPTGASQEEFESPQGFPVTDYEDLPREEQEYVPDPDYGDEYSSEEVYYPDEEYVE